MDSTLTSALRLNNQGVQLLLENNDEEAQACFNQSLDMVKRALLSPAKNKCRDEEESSMDSSSSSDLHHSIHQETHAIPYLRGQDSFIYNKAISFILDDDDDEMEVEFHKPNNKHSQKKMNTKPHQEDEEEGNEGNIHFYSAVIILNIALTYHRQAIISSRNQSLQGNEHQWRIRAERMYDMVTLLLEDVDDDVYDNVDVTTNATITSSLLVKIAAVNNVSQLRRDQGDYESSRDGFEYLGELIDFAEHYLKTTMLWTQEDTIMGMLLNVLLATSPEAAGAA